MKFQIVPVLLLKSTAHAQRDGGRALDPKPVKCAKGHYVGDDGLYWANRNKVLLCTGSYCPVHLQHLEIFLVRLLRIEVMDPAPPIRQLVVCYGVFHAIVVNMLQFFDRLELHLFAVAHLNSPGATIIGLMNLTIGGVAGASAGVASASPGASACSSRTSSAGSSWIAAAADAGSASSLALDIVNPPQVAGQCCEWW